MKINSFSGPLFITIILLVILLICTAAMATEPKRITIDDVLDAIRQVETGGRDIVGDNGAAIGKYQIHNSYWKDSGVKGKYEDCHNDAYSREVIKAYWKRYCPEAFNTVDAKVLSKTHNGGPAGYKKTATIGYWTKVKKILDAK